MWFTPTCSCAFSSFPHALALVFERSCIKQHDSRCSSHTQLPHARQNHLQTASLLDPCSFLLSPHSSHHHAPYTNCSRPRLNSHIFPVLLQLLVQTTQQKPFQSSSSHMPKSYNLQPSFTQAALQLLSTLSTHLPLWQAQHPSPFPLSTYPLGL